MERFICLNPKCKAIFDEEDIVRAVIDRHPYGNGYTNEYACVCPVCRSAEIALAAECSSCGEYVADDEIRCNPITEEPICEDCFQDMIATIETLYLEDYKNGTR